jgi:hypothetical protein
MSSLVLRQHPLLQWFDREPEDTSSIETRGTHYAQQTMFPVTGVSMPLVHYASNTRVVTRSTRCPGLMFFSFTFRSRHLIFFSQILIDVFYCLKPGHFYGVFCHFAILFIFCKAKVFIEPLLASSGVIASSPNKSLNGVKHVDLETAVLWFHTTFINSSGPLSSGLIED